MMQTSTWSNKIMNAEILLLYAPMRCFLIFCIPPMRKDQRHAPEATDDTKSGPQNEDIVVLAVLVATSLREPKNWSESCS
jgi:hypothetical protein